MKPLITVLTITALSCIATYAADSVFPSADGPVRAVTNEPGVVPSGALLPVRALDSMNTRSAHRGTVYEGNIAEDVIDQNGAVLIPKNSSVEMAVRSFPYLGPGGVGMTELGLGIEAITVRGTRYPVATVGETMNAGGIRAHESAIRVIGADESAVETSGSRIHVPANTVLAFQLEDPIRLSGYPR